MNTAAIKAWEKKRPPTVQNNSNRSKRQRRRRRRPRSESSCTSKDIGAKAQETQTQHPPHQTNSNHSAAKTRVSESDHIQSPSIDAANLPSVIVQISQHSSFERDLYITYQSSLLTQGNSSSLVQHPDSGLGESSPEPETSAAPAIEKDGIVPDSQSVPGSSSYVPTSSTSPDNTSIDHPPPTSESQISSSAHINIACNFELSNSSAAGIGNSIEDVNEHSSALEVAESLLSVHTSQRSKSEPAPSSIGTSTSTSSRAQPSSSPRSASDPAKYIRIDQQQTHRDNPVSEKDQSNHDQAVDDSSIPGSQFRGHADFSEEHQRLSEVQVPGSTDSLPKQGLEDQAANSECSLVFQTQVPLAFASQGTRISITSTGKSSQQFSIRIQDPKEFHLADP